MSSEELRKFAEELKSEREKQDVTLAQIASKTRIEKFYLESIESANFSVMPDVYMRAFIKEYSSFLNLDPDEILKKYDVASGRKETITKTADEGNEENNDEQKHPTTEFSSYPEKPTLQVPQKQVLNQQLIIALTVSVIAILVLLYFFVVKNNSEEIITEPSFNEVVKDQKERFKVKDQKMSESIAKGTESLVVLVITGKDTTWVRAKIDGSTTNEFTIYPKTSKTLKANNVIDLILGNAAGVEFELNEKVVDLHGRKGEVKNLKISKEGIKEISTQPLRKNE